jgi:hypothetical protein
MPTPDWPTVLRLGDPNRVEAVSNDVAYTASVGSGSGGPPPSVAATMVPKLSDTARSRIDATVMEQAPAWLRRAGRSDVRADRWDPLSNRLEAGTVDRLRVYVVVCQKGQTNCAQRSTPFLLAMTIDLGTWQPPDHRMLNRPRDGWSIPLEPDR